jgi:hypothetical protein
MIRTQIYLTEEERASLRRASRQTGKSQSELIRQAIDWFVERFVQRDRLTCLRQARGIWEGRTDIPELRQLRRESDRSF